ncbi:MAG TPA: DNA (cytosine-5-)-methyltransferase, partial [Clostridia bacterium]|nr:DNA (cytosine-5-)-methyltransferase [Clostridia bacterium]
MMELKALSLFSGIGGLDLAAEMAGIETAAFCEIEPFPVEVLKKRFPGVPIFGDVRKLKRGDIDGTIDIIHGGFPCQDLSQAGKQRGLEGERSGLWFEMLRVIHEIRPRYVLAENVRGAVNLALDTVYSGLVDEGYKVYPYVIPASAVGAPHQRERLFVVGVREDVADSAGTGQLRAHQLAVHRENGSGGGAGANDVIQSSENGGVAHAGGRRVGIGQKAEREGGRVMAVEGSGAGLWPTPSVHGNYNRAGVSDKSGNGLSTAVNLWPTPHRNCSNGAGTHGDGGLNLQTAVSLWRTPDANCMMGPSSEERMAWKREKVMPISINDQVAEAERGSLWPTPCSRGDNSGGPVGLAGGTRAKKKLDEHVGEDARKKLCSGSLNPAWVEILMGFPLGWTD